MATNQNPERSNNENLNNETLILQSSDKQEFLVPTRAALLSRTMKHMIEDNCDKNVIPLANVDGKTLSKIVVYLNRHAEENISDKEKEEFDGKFFSGEPIEVLADFALAANYLYIKDLLDLACRNIADKIKDKSPRWVRERFNIENDFSPAEEEAIRAEHPWAFAGAADDDDDD